MRQRRRVELGAQVDGFLFQGDAEALLDLGADAVAEGGEVGVGGFAAVDEGEGVAGGDASVAELEAFAEAGLLDEPGGGEFGGGAGGVVGGGPVWDRRGVEMEGAGDVFEVGGGDNWVLEEGAGGASVGVAGSEEHALGAADLADGMVDLDGCGLPAGEVAGEVGVGEVGRGATREAEGDGGDEVAAAGGGVEEAGAVGEAAIRVGELGEEAGVEVERADSVDGLRDLLAVGADVLDGRGAGEAGDAGEALHAGEVEVAGVEDEGVPVEAGGGAEIDVAGEVAPLDGEGEGEVEDEAGKARVGDEQVGAAAERVEGEVVGFGEGYGFEEFGLGANLGEEARGATDAEGGEGGEGDVFLDLEVEAGHGFEDTTAGVVRDA